MGRFDSFKLDLSDFPEEVRKEKSNGGKAAPFRPGRHEDVLITECVEHPENPEKPRQDPTWVVLKLGLKQGRQEMNFFLMLPTKSLVYGEKRSDIPFQRLRDFVKAVGITLTKENASLVIGRILNNPECLVGLRINVIVKHSGFYSCAENGAIVIRSRDDKPVLGDDGVNPLCFPDFAAAKAFAVSQNMVLTSPEAKYFFPPKTPNAQEALDAILDNVAPKAESKKSRVTPF